MQRLTLYLALAAAVAVNVSCGTVTSSNGRGPSFIVLDSLQGVRGGASGGAPSSTLVSDVITNVISPPAPCNDQTPCTVFGDSGQATMHVVMKDAGSATPTTPSPLNDITLSQYRVSYRRADGRNTPGVDIPQPFDGFVTVTITPGGTSFAFSLVRTQAKQEPPLVLLKNPLSAPITGFADVTFFGKDQTGSDISVTGTIQIEFGNFGDTAS
jgi:hypothetical protein